MSEAWLSIAAGGAVGALLRGGLLRGLLERPASDVVRSAALATLLANTLACGLLGIWWQPGGATGDAFVVTGLCGGLSTFSTICADSGRLRGAWRESRRAGAAALYLLLTLATSWGAFQLGQIAGG